MAHRADPLKPKAATLAAGQVSLAFVMGMIALAAFEIAWLGWVLSEPLPNAGNVGGKVTRSLFLWRALPQVVPGVPFSDSYLGLALMGLRHVENLPQRLPILLAGGLIAGAAVSLGSLVLKGLRVDRELSAFERLPLAFGLGTSGLGVLTLILGRLGLIAPWPARIGLVALVAAGAWGRVREGWEPSKGPKADRRPWLGFAAVAGPFLLLMMLGSMLPTIDFDALEYHLQGPKEYFQAGRIRYLPHNVYTNMPFGVEMLHLLGMEVLGDWWSGALVGQFLVMLHAPAAVAMVALATRQWASPRAAWFAAVIYLTTPWIYRLAVIPYVEGPLCYYHAALIWLAGKAWATHPSKPAVERSLWLLVGALAGGAMACKYPALISAVIPFGGLVVVRAWKQKSWMIALAFAAGFAVVIGPWLIKNVVDTGNPVYPLGYQVFGGRGWNAAREAKWTAAHGRRGLSWKELKEGVIDVAGRSDWQSPLYTALAPLALLRPGSRRYAGIILGYAVYLFATWWLLTHRLDRFWLPILPAAAILAGLGSDWTRNRGWLIVLAPLMLISILANLSYSTTALVGYNDWTGDYAQIRREVPKFTDPSLAALDDRLPPDARPLLVGQASVFHLRHPIVYNTVFDDETIETLTKGRDPALILSELRRLGVTHVYVDWFEVERYRRPGNYGFTPYVTPELFRKLMREGVLETPVAIGERQELYRVRFASP